MPTLTEIRRALAPGDCIRARNIMRLFRTIAEKHPEVVFEAMNPRLLSDNNLKNQAVLEMFMDDAELLAKLFDYK